MMTSIFVDADACPVKAEITKVADRHGLSVYMVANGAMRLPESPNLTRVLVGEGFDVADDWIAGRIGEGDIAVTAYIQLAARCLKQAAAVIGPTGRVFDTDNIGNALAMRELKSQLRDMGEIRDHGPAFSKRDRSRFLEVLEETVRGFRRSD